ncbi:MAG TPA: PadR family transcriptional regulator [Gemmatimonadaceae bacterium]|nr:PadR family transcriptional regulator [Gemmatimonadaceae bacterium]
MTASTSSLDLVRGTLDMLILRALAWGPMHGYSVAALIKQRTDDAILIEEGALYPALHRLERNGWVESEWGVSENNRRAKYYRITARGRAQLKAEHDTWKRYVAAVSRVMRPSPGGP